SGAVGGSQALQTLTVNSGNTVSLPAVTTRSGGMSVTGTAITLNGTLDSTSANGGGPISLLPATALTLNQTVTAGTGTIALVPTAGGVNQTAGAMTGAGLQLRGAGTFTLTQAGNDIGTISGNP